jgi:quinoprotein dehydrogenase-associated probable ABC transporter substrate-binding protein
MRHLTHKCIFMLAATVGLLAGQARPAAAQIRPSLLTAGVLRVCADPDNLPFSNDKGEGFENQLAQLLAKAWDSKLEYAWWPVRRGYFARALNGRYCDVALTAPSGLDQAATTKPYFRSAYVILYRKDSGLKITSLDDTTLKHLKIGVNLLNADAENTPPAMAMSSHGVVGNLVGFQTFYSEGGSRPEDIVNAVINRTVDLAIVWGPLAGYFARSSPSPLVMNVVAEDTVSGIPFAFDIAIGVRRRETVLRDSLQTFLNTHRQTIDSLLKAYNFPLLPLTPDSSAAGSR